jgi:hypothetical protein
MQIFIRPRIFDGINIPAQNAGEMHDRREFGVNGIVDPFIQCFRIPATQDTVEAHGQVTHYGEHCRALLQNIDLSGLCICEQAARFYAQSCGSIYYIDDLVGEQYQAT